MSYAPSGIPHFDPSRSTYTGSKAADRSGPNEENGDDETFYPWECVSLHKKDGLTFDLVIKNKDAIMAFIHVVHRHINMEFDPDGKLFSSYK